MAKRRGCAIWLAVVWIPASAACAADEAPAPAERANPAGRLLRAADRDFDGAVSADERSAFLETLDPDGDGAIERERAETLMFSNPDGTGPSGRSLMRDRLILSGAFDRDRDGELEIAAIRQLFTTLDMNEDGRLGPDELPAAIPPRQTTSRRRAIEMAPPALLLRQLDADHDGTVTDLEWPEFVSRADQDSSGGVSEEELGRVLPAVPGDEPWTRVVTDLLDANADGLIARAEVEHFVRACDLDQNGKVDQAERTMAGANARDTEAEASRPEASPTPR